MNQKEAVLKFRTDVYAATQVLEDLAKVGRIGKDGEASTMEEVRLLRTEFAEGAAEFIEGAWLSFDPKPTETELSAAVEKDEGSSGDDEDDTAETAPPLNPA